MYIKKTTYKDNDPVCTITESELIEDQPNEIRDAFYKEFIQTKEVVKVISLIDTVSEDEIDFEIQDYFTQDEIDLLNVIVLPEVDWNLLDFKIMMEDI